jgi:hypothetical protein
MKPTHRAQAEVGLKRQKIAAKRRFLRARRLRVSDLDPYARDLLETFGSATAKLEALDAWFEQKGIVDAATGEPIAPTRLYVAVLNSQTRTLARLEAHVAEITKPDPAAELRAYLEGTDECEAD